MNLHIRSFTNLRKGGRFALIFFLLWGGGNFLGGQFDDVDLTVLLHVIKCIYYIEYNA